MLTTLAVLSQALRTALLAGGFIMVVLAAVDWAVRTRRLNPFSGASRFMRARVEPRLAGIERLVVRSGGHPSATAWWAVFAYVVLALLVLAAADLILETVAEASLALSAGPLGIAVLVVQWTFGFLILALMIRVLSSWIPPLARSRWTAWSIGGHGLVPPSPPPGAAGARTA